MTQPIDLRDVSERRDSLPEFVVGEVDRFGTEACLSGVIDALVCVMPTDSPIRRQLVTYAQAMLAEVASRRTLTGVTSRGAVTVAGDWLDVDQADDADDAGATDVMPSAAAAVLAIASGVAVGVSGALGYLLAVGGAA